jgi:hypothetical protein
VSVASKNNKITDAMLSAVSDFSEFARWPQSAIAQKEAEKTLKELRKLFDQENTDALFRYMTMIYIATQMNEPWRDRVLSQGLKQAWIKLAEILD